MSDSMKKKAKEGNLTPEELEEVKKGVVRAERLATVLDDGMLDPLIGLVEGGGDAATALAGFYILQQAKKAGIPYHKLAIMAGRQALDFAGGSIPIVGDLFDFAYKSNKKNSAMLRKHFEKIQREVSRRKLQTLKMEIPSNKGGGMA